MRKAPRWLPGVLTTWMLVTMPGTAHAAVTHEVETDDGDTTITYSTSTQELSERLRTRGWFMFIQMPDTRKFDPVTSVNLDFEYRSGTISKLSRLDEEQQKRLLRFGAAHDLTFTVDGAKVPVGPMTYKPRAYGDYLGEEMSADVPLATFLKLANGKRIEVTIGHETFPLNDESIADLNALATEAAKEPPTAP